jgi:hypothetical protein
MKHFDMNNIMANSQHRFRKRRSIVIPNWVTIDGIATRMKTGSQVDITLLDFAKILDKVPHKHLLCNLNHYRVNNKMNRWIGSFLENIKQCVHPLTHQWSPESYKVLSVDRYCLCLTYMYMSCQKQQLHLRQNYSRMTAYLPHNQQPDIQRLTTERPNFTRIMGK